METKQNIAINQPHLGAFGENAFDIILVTDPATRPPPTAIHYTLCQ